MKIITISEARALGLTRYFTGKPCKRGHVAERITSNSRCITCSLADQKINRAKHHAKTSETNRRWREANYEHRSSYYRSWRIENADRVRARNRTRDACRIRATPQWLTASDHAAIAAVYVEARRLEDSTGVPHEVDHVVPLRGKRVCGLHVPWNLRAIPTEENRRKSNKCPDD